MIIPIIMLALGFILLIKGGDWFVDGATGIARRFHLPEILIGATVVSIGTTLPEVMVSAGAAVQGSGSIAYGNAIGSIICNTALISAITIAIKPGAAARKSMVLPVSFFYFSAVLYCLGAYIFGKFTLAMGIVLLLTFIIYMTSTVLRMKNSAGDLNVVEEEHEEENNGSLVKDIILLLLGAAVIAVGADLLVDNAILIAEKCGVSEKVIGLTIVALGTSLPELVTAITSLVKGHVWRITLAVLKVQSYSLQEIFRKKLFFLIPFHIFAYEKNFPEYEKDEVKLAELTHVYEKIVEHLNSCAECGIISEYAKGTIIAMAKKVLEALAKKYSKVQEGVGKIMGGKILDYEAKRIRDEERVNTERERQRADEAEEKVKKLEAEIARLKEQNN